MPRLKGERPLVIQKRLAKIADPIVGVAQIIEQIGVPVSGVDEAFIMSRGLTKAAFSIRLVRPGEGAFLGGQNNGRETCDDKENKETRFHGRRLSINSKTSSRVSAGNNRTPLPLPLPL